jgi:hypothetical protein
LGGVVVHALAKRTRYLIKQQPAAGDDETAAPFIAIAASLARWLDTGKI